ncbi:MAG: endonuclease/exonuclease/phosphatase family protein [archaeon]|nr:endonuclease/exonuclease/phosphatase family protein [archaeon]
MPKQLNVVSFNIWGLPDVITSRSGSAPSQPLVGRRERMRAIGSHVVGENESGEEGRRVDVIGFQEAWKAEDRLAIRQLCKRAGLSHAHYFDKGAVGSGLLVVSRFPVRLAEYLPYSLNGKPQRLGHGDWWAGKGVGYLQLAVPPGFIEDAHPEGFTLHLFDTHTHARYGPAASFDEYSAHRLLQLRDFALFASSRSDSYAPQDLVLAVGDFNSPPSSLEMRLFQHASSFRVAPLPPPAATCSSGAQIDFVCLRPSPSWRLLGPSSTAFHGSSPYYTHAPASPSAKISYYSDHLAVMASFCPASSSTISLTAAAVDLSAPLPDPSEELRASLASFSRHLETRLAVHSTKTLFFCCCCGLVFFTPHHLDLSSTFHTILLSIGYLLLVLSIVATALKLRELYIVRSFQQTLFNNKESKE